MNQVVQTKPDLKSVVKEAAMAVDGRAIHM